MIELSVAWRLLERDPVVGVVGDAEPVVVRLHALVAGAIHERGKVDLVHPRQEAAPRIAGLYIGIDRGGEVVFVALRVVRSGLVIAAANPGE